MNAQTRIYRPILDPSDPRWIPSRGCWSAMALDGEIVDGSDPDQVRSEVEDRNLHVRCGYRKLAISGVNVR